MERTAHIEHFATLMYLATQFPWPSVCSLHSAALFEIECGRLRWGDSFSHLEVRLLHGPSNQSRSLPAAMTKQAVQFCKAYQSGKCSFTKDHFGLLKHERKWLQHICAKCWLTKQDIQRHRENSAECPFMLRLPAASRPVLLAFQMFDLSECQSGMIRQVFIVQVCFLLLPLLIGFRVQQSRLVHVGLYTTVLKQF